MEWNRFSLKEWRDAKESHQKNDGMEKSFIKRNKTEDEINELYDPGYGKGSTRICADKR